jgi:tetratricopeptide (TPR) repeat protein
MGDPRSIALGLNFLSPTAIRLGHYQETEAFLQESLRLCQEVGDRWGMGTALRYLGLAALAQGDAVAAQARLRRSLEVFTGFVTGWDIARSLIYLGDASLALGDAEEARGRYAEALGVAEGAQAIPLVWEAQLGLAQVHAQTGEGATALSMVGALLSQDAAPQESKERAARLHAELEARLRPWKTAMSCHTLGP